MWTLLLSKCISCGKDALATVFKTFQFWSILHALEFLHSYFPFSKYVDALIKNRVDKRNKATIRNLFTYNFLLKIPSLKLRFMVIIICYKRSKKCHLLSSIVLKLRKQKLIHALNITIT